MDDREEARWFFVNGKTKDKEVLEESPKIVEEEVR